MAGDDVAPHSDFPAFLMSTPLLKACAYRVSFGLHMVVAVIARVLDGHIPLLLCIHSAPAVGILGIRDWHI
jgi:hypothetical protein